MDRRSLRARKVSERIGVLDETDQRQALAARLEALEEDRVQPDATAPGSDDEEFVFAESDEEGTGADSQGAKKRRRKSGGSMRRTRGMIAEQARGPKTFRDWLEESGLVQEQSSTKKKGGGAGSTKPLAPADRPPSYITATVGPPRTASPRHFCSVCGQLAKYTCPRCAARFCSRRCNTTHVETRCLKFTM